MIIKTKKVIMTFSAILAFATVSSNINFINTTASAKTNKAKKHINKKVNKSRNKNTFNKIYSNKEAENMISQKIIPFINSIRQRNGHKPLIFTSNLSKLANERAELINSGNQGVVNMDIITHDKSQSSFKGAYIDGFEMGIFTNDENISKNIYEFGFANETLPNAIRYSNILDTITRIETYINNSVSNSYNNDDVAALAGVLGNGHNYAGISFKLKNPESQSNNKIFAMDVITSDVSY